MTPFLPSHEATPQFRAFAFLSLLYNPDGQSLHARRHQLALLACVVLPAAGQGGATVLRGKLLHASDELGPEVADETLDRPGKGFPESCT